METMLKFFKNLVVFSFVVLFACAQPESSSQTQNPSTTYEDPFLLIDPIGDTIPTGVSIPAENALIKVEGAQVPISMPLRAKPITKPAHENVQMVRKLRTTTIPLSLKRLTPGQGDSKPPKRIAARGRRVPCIEPKPMVALPPRMKDAAIADIKYLDIDQGMISSYVWCLLEDSKGDLWFGTNNGISRYDGMNFRHYSTETGLPSNRTRSLLEDSQGNIWIGTDGGGVCYYDGVAFTHYNSQGGLGDDHVWSMLEDREGNIWFGSDTAGVFRFDGVSFTQYGVEQGLSHNIVWSMLQDSRGDLWFGTKGGGLTQFDGTSFTHYTEAEGLSSNDIWSLLQDHSGDLWVGTEQSGFNRLRIPREGIEGEIIQFELKTEIPNATVWSMEQDDHNNLWIGTEFAGLFQFDGQTATQYSTEQGLGSNRVWSMYHDGLGNLWLGTRGGGVNRFRPNSFTHVTAANGLNTDAVLSICEDEHKNIWFGTWSGGVNRYDGSNFTYFTKREGLINEIITAIIEDRNGHMWFATEGGGLVRYDGSTFTNYNTTHGLLNDDVQCLFQDADGKIWFGNQGGGIGCFDGSSFFYLASEHGLSNHTVRAIFQDRNGDLWFGSQGAGVCRYDGKSFTHYTTNEGLANNMVWTIAGDSNGQVWFGTQGGGLSRFDGQRFQNFSTHEGLSHDWVWSVNEDKEGKLWVSTEKGITLMTPRPSDPLNYDFFTFGKDDGMKRLDFSQNSLLAHDNRMWWGTIDGLTLLDLNRFSLPRVEPSLRLNTVEIRQNFIDYRRLEDDQYQQSLPFGRSLVRRVDSIPSFKNFPSTLSLPTRLNHVTFDFTAIDWSAPHKIQYSYILEGLDEEWSPLTAITRVDYRNLPPGDFQFKVRARGASLVWSEQVTYPVSVSTPWWLTWWALLLFALVGIILIWMMVRLRIAGLKARKKELEATVEERTAEVEARRSEAVVERNRSDELLLNILPAKVADELKSTGRTTPEHFEEVSILFADFKEFTNIVASIPGKKLVQELDDIFQHFDDIMEAQGVEKIQTIGDGYVAVCGLPTRIPDHALRCVAAGRQMLEYLETRNVKSAIKWKLRIGIHSGPVTAGVVGKRKFSYDIFGDSVNIAARLQASSEEGQINVSAYTFDLIKDHHACTYRGKIDAKGKGPLDMYYLKS